MAEQRTQHLYLVFDDWHSGYSIRKVSLSRRSANRCRSDQSSDSESEQPAALPSGSPKGAKALPVFMRVPALRGYPQFFTSAFGTKIMAMHPVRAGGTVPAIDVQDHTITFERIPNAPVFPIYFPVGDDRLFHLDFGELEVLRKPPDEPAARGQQPAWEWQQLPSPPFPSYYSSYVVLPDGDGCSILVSTTRTCHATFVFDTKEEVWRKYGDWAFPFTGLGHYDTSLEGFVGLSKNPDTLGYLYCCTMSMASSTVTPGHKGLHPKIYPNFKCTKEQVYNKNPTEGQHVSATLVHKRPGRFCLVECVCIDDSGMTDYEELPLPPGGHRLDFWGGGPQGGRFVYHLKTFSLSYDTKGDCLKLTHCKVRCYNLPREA